MTAPDNWPALETFRCRDVAPSGRRCQLYASHDEAHAAAWTQDPGTRRFRFRWIRWDAAGEREQEPGSERLPWCAMHRP